MAPTRMDGLVFMVQLVIAQLAAYFLCGLLVRISFALVKNVYSKHQHMLRQKRGSNELILLLLCFTRDLKWRDGRANT